jgi:hypothetical protein
MLTHEEKASETQMTRRITPEQMDVAEEVDFDVVKENWTRYSLSDKTLLRVRIGVLKVVKQGVSQIGTPNFAVASQNILSAMVPPSLINKDEAKKPHREITADDIKAGTDLDFDLVEKPEWQEYRTKDGWIVMIKPEVGKIVKLNLYNELGEPAYWANIQSTFRVKKAS